MLLLASSKATEVNDILIFNDPQYNSWILAVLFAEVGLVILVPVGTGLQSVFGVQDSLVAQWWVGSSSHLREVTGSNPDKVENILSEWKTWRSPFCFSLSVLLANGIQLNTLSKERFVEESKKTTSH